MRRIDFIRADLISGTTLCHSLPANVVRQRTRPLLGCLISGSLGL